MTAIEFLAMNITESAGRDDFIIVLKYALVLYVKPLGHLVVDVKFFPKGQQL